MTFDRTLPDVILDESAEDYTNILENLGCEEEFEIHTGLENCPVACDVLLASAPLAEEFLRTGRSARWIQSTWAGNAKLIPLLKGTDTVLTGIKGVFGPLIAEYVFSYILPEIRDTKRSAQAQQQRKWDYFEPASLQGKVFVFVGTGSIGAHVASVAKMFGMITIGVSRSGTGQEGFDQVYRTDQLRHSVELADYILLSVPETPASFHLVGKDTLAAVKPGATLFNVGRGSTLDVAAVVDSLGKGVLSSAVLDVFEEEPLPVGSPLWHTQNLIITPHIAAVSSPDAIAKKFMNNLMRYRRGDELIDVIDPAIGY